MGRAAAMIRAEPDSRAVRAELLRACRLDLAYDRQCEESRAPYLHRLILETGDASSYVSELERRLAARDADETDRVQIFAILCLAAAGESGVDRDRLRDFLQGGVERGSFGPGLDEGICDCAERYVGLEGIEGLLYCVRRFHALLLENAREQGGWAFLSWVEALQRRDGDEAASTGLREARGRCEELDGLLRLEEARPAFTPREARTGIDYPTARAELRDPKRSPPTDWIRSASIQDLVRVADDLLSERDEKIVWRYLRVFRLRDYPRRPGDLFGFLENPNPRIAQGAAAALAKIRSPETRALALEFLSRGERPSLAVELLVGNFEPGDCGKIEEALALRPLDEREWHSVGLSLFQVIGKNEATREEFRPLLFRLYEEGPCSLCRWTMVSNLLASGGVPNWMAEECRFDAEPETVRLFEGAGPSFAKN